MGASRTAGWRLPLFMLVLGLVGLVLGNLAFRRLNRQHAQEMASCFRDLDQASRLRASLKCVHPASTWHHLILLPA